MGIAEGTRLNGAPITGINNNIRYTNVRVRFVIGKDTRLFSLSEYGRVYRSGTVNCGNILNAASNVLSEIYKWWLYGSSVVSALQSVTDRGIDVTMGGGNVQLYSQDDTAAVTETCQDYLFANGYDSSSTGNLSTAPPAHYIQVQVNVNSLCDPNQSTQTAGAVSFQWDVYRDCGATLLEERVRTIQQLYLTGYSV